MLLDTLKPIFGSRARSAPGGRARALSSTVEIAFLATYILLSTVQVTLAEAQPGDVFREYMHTNWYGDAGGAIRVGGKNGVSYPDRGSDFDYINTPREFGHKLDLEHAVRAELFVEKILSHNGTEGLAISWNDSPWISLPPPKSLPDNAEDFYHHTIIEAPIPLECLREDWNNTFRLRVSEQQDWNWPQHLVYGVHLRVFYDAEKVQRVHATLDVESENGKIGESVQLGVTFDAPPRRIQRVDYVGKFKNVNWFGDGRFTRWQYFYYRGNLIHHIASSVTRDFSVQWDTTWVPDQDEPLSLAARVIDDDGLIVMTEAVQNLELERPELSVELCTPESVPDNWVTRNGEHSVTTNITGKLEHATDARLAWSSWSPGYMNGVSINGKQIIASEGPLYRYFDHFLPIDDLSVLRAGSNTISTGKTPLYDGKMVHGMEVNWPGIQLLIRYRK